MPRKYRTDHLQIQYRAANKKVPNKNIMLTLWGTLRKMGYEKRLGGEFYTKAFKYAMYNSLCSRLFEDGASI